MTSADSGDALARLPEVHTALEGFGAVWSVRYDAIGRCEEEVAPHDLALARARAALVTAIASQVERETIERCAEECWSHEDDGRRACDEIYGRIRALAPRYGGNSKEGQ